MRSASRAYSDPAVVAKVSRWLVDQGYTVLQIHRLAESQPAHVGALLKFFDPPRGAHILDIGCGVGGVAELMSAERPDLRFTLLNKSAEQLALCPDRFETLCADAHQIPLPDGSVDATMICYALGHMDLDAALKECSRVTRPGGHLFLYELTGEDSRRLLTAMDFEAYPVSRIEAAAAQAGFALDNRLLPGTAHLEHFYDKMPAAQVAWVLEGVRPALFRFRKSVPTVRVGRVKKLKLLAAAALASFLPIA